MQFLQQILFLIGGILFGSNAIEMDGSSDWSVTVSTKGKAKPGELIFVDEFETFNLNTWSHEITAAGGGNEEFQIYENNRSNSFVQDGKLHIIPTLTADKYGEDFLYHGTLNLNDGANQCTNTFNDGCLKKGSPTSIIPPIISAGIKTVKSFAFKYGRIVVRAKLPSGDWLWPAIWMLPQHNKYGGWPASGEIDIMESRGNRKLRRADGRSIGSDQFGSTLHFGPHTPLNGWQKAHFEINSEHNEGFDKQFHDYELEWTPNHMKFYLDSKEVGTVNIPSGGFWELGEFDKETTDNPWENADNPKMAPFDQMFHIIINLAVGGTNGYFPDSEPPRPWRNGIPQGQAALEFWKAKEQWLPTWNDAAFIIDSVKVYAL